TEAAAGRSVTLLLAHDLDVSRGDLVVGGEPPRVTDEFDATLCWLAERPLTPGARVLLKHGTRTVQAVVTDLHTRFDEQKLARTGSPDSLNLNEIGQVALRTAEPVPIDEYTRHRRTGAFLVIDATDGSTLAAGLVGAPLPVPDVVVERAEGGTSAQTDSHALVSPGP
ncbi:elongation factor 1-alpha C-terminal domain-related protein, partial [Saccharothrix obliqua]|uniref:elongation factor 1-alpha C-terminal domain-related protein n=1 Tax=Saccharothrix obliqua TaxID=2861747 RepID=UPI003FD7DD56|nr:sulfate adenylyltransferase [Saccharothrix obliqua]